MKSYVIPSASFTDECSYSFISPIPYTKLRTEQFSRLQMRNQLPVSGFEPRKTIVNVSVT
jgi:hypothetical protein